MMQHCCSLSKVSSVTRPGWSRNAELDGLFLLLTLFLGLCGSHISSISSELFCVLIELVVVEMLPQLVLCVLSFPSFPEMLALLWSLVLRLLSEELLPLGCRLDFPSD